MNWKSVLSEDLSALGLPPKWKLKYCVTNRIAYFMLLLRITESYSDSRGIARLAYYALRFKLDRVSERLGFDIPLHTFDSGLSIAHRGTIVVNGEARIGRNCRLHPGVTIGAVRGQAPTIGDNVFIGPGVGIYGDIHIGSRVILGPNALVNFSVEEDQTLVGARASVLARSIGKLSREEEPWRRPPLKKE